MFRPVPRGIFLALLTASVGLRVFLATLPGYVSDVESYKRWALGAAIAGLPAAYEVTGVDYPPLFLYALYGAGRIQRWIEPESTPADLRDSALFTFLVKSPHLIFDLLLGGLLYWLVAVRGLWGTARTGVAWGRLVALLYLWNPAVLFGSGYWGQPDGIHSALAVAALAALAWDRAAASGALLSFAGLMKPLAAPLVPLLVLAAGARRGLRGLVLAGGGGLAAALLTLLPFLATGRIGPVLRKILLDVEAMPFTSVNAHNLWWLLGAWRDANAPILGPLTPRTIGLTLFLVSYAALLTRAARLLRSPRIDAGALCARLFLGAAAVVCSFFFLSTHMHENHMFLAIPLLLAVAGRSRHLAWLALGCSLAVFFNMALHDLELPYCMPSFLSMPVPVTNRHLDRPFTLLQLVGSYLNTLLVAAVSASTWLCAWRGKV